MSDSISSLYIYNGVCRAAPGKATGLLIMIEHMFDINMQALLSNYLLIEIATRNYMVNTVFLIQPRAC